MCGCWSLQAWLLGCIPGDARPLVVRRCLRPVVVRLNLRPVVVRRCLRPVFVRLNLRPVVVRLYLRPHPVLLSFLLVTPRVRPDSLFFPTHALTHSLTHSLTFLANKRCESSSQFNNKTHRTLQDYKTALKAKTEAETA